MSPDTVWLCCTLAAGLLLAWAWHGACREDRRRWEHSTRTKDDVRTDLAAARAARDRLQAAADLADCIAIWDLTHHDIPQQRTEEDQ
ncbi:hypothetical protein ACFY7H_13250 [Streptomyces sp. NPDC012794]|uniref:hypothetical protein n=1 Tax=Streptomyces sp. NPDC012794 TaxID=3364850 RepID=UPI0036A92B82